ncbi:GPW/gp25 family protein [Paenibacillus bouchesdurhonensis]|uniref:lysozyme n=1 Tax=Paenibacillus bouchesdurhonensis TaxID=1870990 RepID=UPI000DA61180|nr:lysozyme [Paenibacillus bouchesdurhonensis]
MIYTVDMAASREWVNFNPTTLQDEVGQNIRTIVTTILGSVPGSRSIGMDVVIDEPINVLTARIAAEIMVAVSEQEPRAVIASVEVIESSEESAIYGRLSPVIKYTLAGEGEGFEQL